MVSSNFKSNGTRFFERKIILGNLVKKLPKIDLNWGFSSFMKSSRVEISDLLHEVAATWSMKFDFLGEVLIQLYIPKMCQNISKLGLASFMKNWCPEQKFLHKFTVALSFKTGLNYFEGKILLWSFGARGDQNEAKMRFFKLYQKFFAWFFTFFLTFCMWLQNYKDLKLTIFFWEGVGRGVMIWSFCIKRGPKGAWNEVFDAWNFSHFLYEVQLSEVRARLFGRKPS